MNTVFGVGITKEDQVPFLSQELPPEIRFVEIPGDLLDVPAVLPKLKKVTRQHKALVIQDIMPSYLIEALPVSPLRLKIEFDSKFRSRCQAAAKLGCRVIAADFNIERALREADYNLGLMDLLASMSGTLEEFKLLMALPIRIPRMTGTASATSLLAFKHRLFYPGFRFRLDFYYNEPEAFETLEKDMPDLNFERNFWRLPYMPEPDILLDDEIFSRMRSFWDPVQSRIPVFVCFAPGMVSPDQLMLKDLTRLIRDFSNEGNDKSNEKNG